MGEPLGSVDVDRRDGGDVVLIVRGEVDISNAGEVRSQLLAAATDAPKVSVDLRDVRYIDSQGMRLLADLAAALHGQELVVVAPPGSVVGELLSLMGIDQLVTVRSTLDEG